MLHIGSKCETQRVSRFSSQKCHRLRMLMFMFSSLRKQKSRALPDPTPSLDIIEIIMHCTHSMSSHQLVKSLQLILEISTGYSYLLADSCYNSNRK